MWQEKSQASEGALQRCRLEVVAPKALRKWSSLERMGVNGFGAEDLIMRHLKQITSQYLV